MGIPGSLRKPPPTTIFYSPTSAQVTSATVAPLCRIRPGRFRRYAVPAQHLDDVGFPAGEFMGPFMALNGLKNATHFRRKNQKMRPQGPPFSRNFVVKSIFTDLILIFHEFPNIPTKGPPVAFSPSLLSRSTLRQKVSEVTWKLGWLRSKGSTRLEKQSCRPPPAKNVGI